MLIDFVMSFGMMNVQYPVKNLVLVETYNFIHARNKHFIENQLSAKHINILSQSLSTGNFESWAIQIPILHVRKLRKSLTKQVLNKGVVKLSFLLESLTSLWLKAFHSGKNSA